MVTNNVGKLYLDLSSTSLELDMPLLTPSESPLTLLTLLKIRSL